MLDHPADIEPANSYSTMTVKELIKVLKEYPKDLRVVVRDGEWEYRDIEKDGILIEYETLLCL